MDPHYLKSEGSPRWREHHKGLFEIKKVTCPYDNYEGPSRGLTAFKTSKLLIGPRRLQASRIAGPRAELDARSTAGGEIGAVK